jgi:superfamily I DNA/RNA helicase
LIDEAQDWPCSWFQCARLALKVPETGDLLIVGDGSQSLYRKRDFTWADAGVHASGRVINRKFDLDRNYRNTAEILRAARVLCAARKRHAERARLTGRARHRHPLRA